MNLAKIRELVDRLESTYQELQRELGVVSGVQPLALAPKIEVAALGQTVTDVPVDVPEEEGEEEKNEEEVSTSQKRQANAVTKDRLVEFFRKHPGKGFTLADLYTRRSFQTVTKVTLERQIRYLVSANLLERINNAYRLNPRQAEVEDPPEKETDRGTLSITDAKELAKSTLSTRGAKKRIDEAAVTDEIKDRVYQALRKQPWTGDKLRREVAVDYYTLKVALIMLQNEGRAKEIRYPTIDSNGHHLNNLHWVAAEIAKDYESESPAN